MLIHCPECHHGGLYRNNPRYLEDCHFISLAPGPTNLTDNPSLLDLDFKYSCLSKLPQVLPNGIHRAQRQDLLIRRVVKMIQSGQCPTRRQQQLESPDTQHLLHEWPRLTLDSDGILQHANTKAAK